MLDGGYIYRNDATGKCLAATAIPDYWDGLKPTVRVMTCRLHQSQYWA